MSNLWTPGDQPTPQSPKTFDTMGEYAEAVRDRASQAAIDRSFEEQAERVSMLEGVRRQLVGAGIEDWTDAHIEGALFALSMALASVWMHHAQQLIPQAGFNLMQKIMEQCENTIVELVEE